MDGDIPPYGVSSRKKRRYEVFSGEEYDAADDAGSHGRRGPISPLPPLGSISQLQHNGTALLDESWFARRLSSQEPTSYPGLEYQEQNTNAWTGDFTSQPYAPPWFSELRLPPSNEVSMAQEAPSQTLQIETPHWVNSIATSNDAIGSGSGFEAYVQLGADEVNPVPKNPTLDTLTPIEQDGNQEARNPTSQPIQQRLVCFGMVTGVAGTCYPPASFNPLHKYLVKFTSIKDFVGIKDAEFKGEVIPKCTYITSALLDEAELELEARCFIEVPSKTKGSGSLYRRVGFSRPCSLDIIIYGPEELFKDVGEFFQDHDLYLQDPVGCERNVPYLNPHRLPQRSNITIFTATLGDRSVQQVVEEVDVRPELLDILNSQEDLAEAEQPSSVRTQLARHQKQALTFMRRREHGWAWDGSSPDIWEAVESGQGHYFANRISNVNQVEEPPQFYGGIVADPMGLGKTLSMIALIACDMNLDYSDPSSLAGADIEEPSGRTLIIVPPPLLISWEEQLKQHIFPNSLPWCRHHDKSRLTDPSQLESTMIVLTTYHTVSAEWRHGRGNETSILFKTRWKRIVLDEAHFIRNTESQISRAICALDSVSRWAVTGTPIQNKLGDLTALLMFLKVYPYSEKRVFEADISHLWKSGKEEEAVKRLKRLSSCLILRRPKGTIQLPERRDLQHPVEFTMAERRLYEDIRTQVIAHIEEALQTSDTSRTNSFVNVLQRIEAMRMICNLGLHYPSRHELFRQTESSAEKWDSTAQGIFNVRRNMGQIQCNKCSSILDTDESLLDDANRPSRSLFSRCMAYTCSSCTEKSSQNGEAISCGHYPPCPVATILTEGLFTDESPVLTTSNFGGHMAPGFPTKINALLRDLNEEVPSDVKCVVFSTWRMTLDLVQTALDQASIPSLRFDGKVPQKDRQGVIDRFRNDPSVRVLLLTLSCGAVGLTLTVASRAYLMEPHWNPTLEDQALARIHRMGQTRDVTTVRFFVRNSFEERVIEAQESKRDLAGILLNPYSKAGHEGQSGTATRPLEWLRALI